jgi:prepilin-type N-terminal cleavage/methylation domain-containing protein
MRRREQSSGFTLIEIMVSMALLVIGLLGVIALHATTAKGNRLSRELERARVFATQMMEELRGLDPALLTEQTKILEPVLTNEGVTYNRSYAVTSVAGMRLLTVRVEFFEAGDEDDVHAATLQMLRTVQEKL